MKFSSYITTISVSLFICAIVFFTIKDYGVTWDEPAYIQAGKKYVEWIMNPSLKTIDEYWAKNREHPPLAKILGGFTGYIFHDRLGWFDSTLSYRISILLFIFLLNFSLFKFVSELYGDCLALIVTVTFSFMPRVFFHSHIGALDYPVTAMWFLVVYTYWKGQKDKKWIIISSVILGFALLTKLNAFFLYVPILFQWILNYKKEIAGLILKRYMGNRMDYRKGMFELISMLVFPPIIFISFWPWLWQDTFNRVIEYGFFHINHLRVPVYYLGNTYFKAPWEYPILLTIITIPIIFLFLFLLGIIRNNFKSHRDFTLIILFNALFPLFIISASKTKYDGIRLFLPAFPFIAIIAGIGTNYLFGISKTLKFQKAVIFIYTLLFLLTIYFSIIRYHPYQISYFNALVGGVDGACQLGFEPEYWGSPYREMLPWLEENQGKIYWIYVNPDPFYHYQMDGMLSQNVIFSGRDDADYVILLSRFGMFNEEAWRFYRDIEPVFSVRVSNTKLASIYKLD